ncbi:class I SAM-dependent methyltransferase [Longimicrobium sp.]|uniref:class I SAM-dependent methyltransferase n=1 Tax=Longimicrobium sp. TaxID=2029185 RepID=UPI002E37A938|nr:class I SAM-dependent methyltransferase [Longimicrobium sp.]HEX6041268.1 class I SAM-dependent methyltransferase [Longimicrobium sp.]
MSEIVPDLPRRDVHEANRRSWNAATEAHNRHKGDQAAFLRAGGSTLFPEELALLGDVDGRALVHLQCNAGQDTLSLARLGARATGVDISDEAVAFARRLSAESGIAARFERADVYDWLRDARGGGRRFDVAFSSYGVLSWLSDLRAWARGIADVLAPGGRLVLVEFHPVLGMFDEELALRHPYSGGGAPIPVAEGIGDYVADSAGGLLPEGGAPAGEAFRNPHPTYEFAWGLGDVVQAVVDAGLRIGELREWPYSNGYRPFHEMVMEPGRRWRLPDGVPALPLMFGLVAHKAEDTGAAD